MPAPLVHIAFARSYHRHHPELDELLLLRGTTFPDIRRMAQIMRDHTHSYGLTLADVEAETDPWKVGMMLHSYLDEAWFEVLGRLGEAEDSHDRLFWFAVKQAEEADFYGPSEGNQHIAELYRHEPLAQELDFGVAPEVVTRWNKFLVWKLLTRHTPNDWAHQGERIGHSAAQVQKMLETIEFVRQDAAWQEKLRQLHTELGITGTSNA